MKCVKFVPYDGDTTDIRIVRVSDERAHHAVNNMADDTGYYVYVPKSEWKAQVRNKNA